MIKHVSGRHQKIKTCCIRASLTVEAALVMPVFLYCMIAFLYFIQIMTLQEHIQSELTKMGLNWSKSAYLYQNLPEIDEVLSLEQLLPEGSEDYGLNELADRLISQISIKLYASTYLNKDWINHSCIKNGFDGIDFSLSDISKEECIDIVLKYKVSIPVKLIIIGDMNMLQRVRLHNWTGYEVAAAYSEEEAKETVVYITSTGKVYHKSRECTYLKPSVTAVDGIPDKLRNEGGARYQRCKYCCRKDNGDKAVYYITKYGNKYHAERNCPKIKRDVKEIPLSEAGSRRPCSKCGK